MSRKKITHIMNLDSVRNFFTNPEIYKFITVGISAAISVYLLTIFFTSILGIYVGISVALAYEISVIWVYFPLDRWTFSNVKRTTSSKKRFIKYNLFALIGLTINESVLLFLVEKMELHYTISVAIAIIVAFVFNFSISKKVTWKN